MSLHYSIVPPHGKLRATIPSVVALKDDHFGLEAPRVIGSSDNRINIARRDTHARTCWVQFDHPAERS